MLAQVMNMNFMIKRSFNILVSFLEVFVAIIRWKNESRSEFRQISERNFIFIINENSEFKIWTRIFLLQQKQCWTK